MSDNQLSLIPFDYCSFVLSGNLLITLVRKGVITIDEADSIISTTRQTIKEADSFRQNAEIDLNWHLDNLSAQISDYQKD